MNPGDPLAAGHMLDGRYRINKVIGQGGMGRVYLANDTRLANRPVAVKEMIVGEGIQERKAVEDFAREARVLAPLSHPGIPNLIDYFVENARHYLVMEYVAGGDLQHWLDAKGKGARAPEAQVLRWSRQILEVLDFIHAQDPPIVYRDLKPANIMIDKSGHAMLIDFGIARFLPPGGRGTQIGSVGYAPPEQYLGKMEPRSDLYSLGATMHHLLTGRDPQLEPPFSFPGVRLLAPEVSGQTDEVVMRALDKDVAKRPSSAREMFHLLPDPGIEEYPVPGGARASSSPLRAPEESAGGSSGSMLARMRTIVLHRPASQPPTSSTRTPAEPPKPISPLPPALQRNMARVPTAPGMRIVAPSVPKVSPTAKTQDLRRSREIGVKKKSGATPVAPQTGPSARSPVSGSAKPKPAGHGRPEPSVAVSLPPNASGSVNGPAAPTRHAPSSSPRRGPRLVARAERVQFILSGAKTVIGRSASAEDRVDMDLSGLKIGVDRVSRHHAEIIKQGPDYYIRDLGSMNGTYIVGRGRLGRDQLYKLNDHDNVVLGGAAFEFHKE